MVNSFGIEQISMRIISTYNKNGRQNKYAPAQGQLIALQEWKSL